PGLGADDGSLKAGKQVQQRGFAYVGRAADDGACSSAEDAAMLRGIEQALKQLEKGLQTILQLAAGIGINVFLGKVDVGLDVRYELNEVSAESFSRPPETAFELASGSLQS